MAKSKYIYEMVTFERFGNDDIEYYGIVRSIILN